MRFADLLLRLQGSTSGETIVRAAAAASGAITLPAGTTDFSGTGGAGQVVKQTTAGGAFTVAQVAAATDISGQVPVANGGTGATTAPAALTNLGAAPIASPTFTGTVTGNIAIFNGAFYANAASQFSAGLHVTTGGPLNVDSAATFGSTLAVHGNTNPTLDVVSSGGFTALYAPDGTGVGGTGGCILLGTVANTNFYYRGPAHTFQPSNFSANWAIFDSASTRNISGSWAVISDRGLKKDVAPYERGLAAVMQLAPISFRYAGPAPDVPDDEQVRYGLVADEVANIMPEIVGESRVGDRMVATLSPGLLVYPLINAVKELAARVEVLEAQLER